MTGLVSAATIAGTTAVIGGAASYMGAKESAKATERANKANLEFAEKELAQQREGFEMTRPYFDSIYSDAQIFTDNALNQGPYSRLMYEGLDPKTVQGLDSIYGRAQNNLGLSNQMMADTSGFARNASDLYNLAQEDRLANAMDFATGDYANSLLANAMRDPYRQLTEQTLTGIDASAARSGNTNASRAGVAEAIARRAYDDRVADTATNIQRNLINQSLDAQGSRFDAMTQANQNLGSIFGDAYNFGTGLSQDMVDVGQAYRDDRMDALTADKERYEYFRGDPMDVLGRQAGIMEGAPQSTTGSSGYRGQQPNLYSPTASGITGALGAGLTAYDFMKDNNFFQNTTPTTPTVNVDLGSSGGANFMPNFSLNNSQSSGFDFFSVPDFTSGL